MSNLQIRNVPEDIHRALRAWATEEKSSVSALVLSLLKQQLKLRAFERSLHKIPPLEKAQDSVRGLQEERDKR